MQTKTELGDALVKKVKTGDFGPSELWCLARLGARELFYGPMNQVAPPNAVTRWVEALLGKPAAAEAVAVMARHTGQTARDLPPATLELVRRNLSQLPDGDRLLPILNGETDRDIAAMGRMFGEDLPSGLVFAEGQTPEN